MKLLIDGGNSRLKWALADSQGNYLQQGYINNNELAEQWLPTVVALSQSLVQLPTVWISNVAGPHVAQQLELACPAQYWQKHSIESKKQQCGVHNQYEHPEKLGCDRWAALIAAWKKTQGTCLVVNCGTATTIDALLAGGEFVGGLILPGIQLMQHSLLQNTHIHSLTPPQQQTFPRNTSNALFNGALLAHAGAVLLQHQQLNTADAPIILSGGAAPVLAQYLQQLNRNYHKPPIEIVDNLVLRGLHWIAQEHD